MAVISRRQPSAVVFTGLSAATVALNVAGAAADAVPIAKQILNSAAQISAAAERIQKKREAMYTLVEKADIYATQIDIAVAGRVLNASLKRRLERLYSVFLKIQALVDAKAGSKSHTLTRVWQNVVTKPSRAETLGIELDREVQLFQLLTGIQVSLVVDDTARAVTADANYDGQIRNLRDSDIEKRNIIMQRTKDEGTVVWASGRVDGQPMVIRYVDRSSIVKRDEDLMAEAAPRWPRMAPYHEYIESVKKLSTVNGSHPHVAQLYGHHIHGLGTAFRAGALKLDVYLTNVLSERADNEAVAVIFVTLMYKMLDASSYLTDSHGLMWVGHIVLIDEHGEPRIGLFDDIVQTDRGSEQLDRTFLPGIFTNMLMWFNLEYSKETGVVEQVHDSDLTAILTEQLLNGNDTDCLQSVWDVIRHERLSVSCSSLKFPNISGNLSLSQRMIARAQRHFGILTKKESLPYPTIVFMRRVLAGDVNISSRILISFWRSGFDSYGIIVRTCAYDDSRIRYDVFYIDIPTGCPIWTQVARVVGVPVDFDTTAASDTNVDRQIYEQ